MSPCRASEIPRSWALEAHRLQWIVTGIARANGPSIGSETGDGAAGGATGPTSTVAYTAQRLVPLGCNCIGLVATPATPYRGSIGPGDPSDNPLQPMCFCKSVLLLDLKFTKLSTNYYRLHVLR